MQLDQAIKLNRVFSKGKKVFGLAASKQTERKNEQTQPEHPANSHQVIAIIGAKGGVGASTLAIDVATALAMSGETTLVDANFQQPDVAGILGQEPLHTITELLDRPGIIDKTLFDACKVQIGKSRVSVLSPPLDGHAGVKSNLTQLAQSLTLMRSHSHAWVLDLPRHIDRHLVTILDMCTKILLIFEATVSGIAMCKRWLATFRELGYEDSHILCVLNRAGAKFKDVEEQVDDCFPGRRIFRVPNASMEAWQSSTKGEPILTSYPNHRYSKAILQLRDEIQK